MLLLCPSKVSLWVQQDRQESLASMRTCLNTQVRDQPTTTALCSPRMSPTTLGGVPLPS